MAAALESADLVDFLITNNGYFSTLPLEDKLQIKTAKPTPPLLMEKKDMCGKFTRRFQRLWYTNFTWLTGSLKRNRLFCFICLLFSQYRDEWSKFGIGDESLKNMTAKMKKHECSSQHIFAAVKFNQLGSVKVDHVVTGAARLEAIKHNENVNRNRLIVKRLISTICFLARQELPFGDQDESENSLDKGNYLEILDFLAEEESHMKTHLVHSTVFKDTSSRTQIELIESATDAVNEIILNEVSSSHFISIQVDETTDVSTENKLSVILRYANLLNGEIEERFVGFYDVSTNKTAQGVSDVVLEVLRKWKIGEEKFVCQSYDGACATPGTTEGAFTIIKKKYPHVIFIHSYTHQLNLVLLHGGKTIKQVKLFVANLTAFRNFFNRSTKRMVLLQEKGFTLPRSSETRWDFHSRSVSTILAHFSELRAAIEDILNEDGWDSNTISLAIGLKRSLSDIQFVFLLHLYNKIFQYTSILSDIDIMEMKNIDMHGWNMEVRNCLSSLKSLKREATVFACAEETKMLLFPYINDDDEDWEEDREDKKFTFSDRLFAQLRVTSFEILDNIIANVKNRFEDLQKLDFIRILHEEKFELYNRAVQNFPDNVLENLMNLYPFFDKSKLKGELMFIYGCSDKRMPPNELFKYLINNNLKDVLPETIKLLSLVLCIPATPASCEISMSTLKRIKTYLRKSMADERLSNISTLAIEKGLVKTSASQQEFLSRTIDIFAEKKIPRPELVYKKI